MLNLLRKPPPPEAAPARVIYAVGDIHGRDDLLADILAQIEADWLSSPNVERPILVFLGDYIDRGLQSRQVIERLLALPGAYETRFVRGNHEAALLAFLERPETGRDWIALGGAETLYAYGVDAPPMRAGPAALKRCAEALRRAMPASHLDFLQRLELFVRVDDYLFVHAGLRPGRELGEQTEADMLSIRKPFLRDRRRWPFVVVHGHSPTPAPLRDKRRISLDTGAYATGRLSAARLQGPAVRFLVT